MSPPSVSVPISLADSSQAGYARRQALALANLMDFGELRRGQLAIVVTEAAANIAAHAERGELAFGPLAISRRCRHRCSCPRQWKRHRGCRAISRRRLFDRGLGRSGLGSDLTTGGHDANLFRIRRRHSLVCTGCPGIAHRRPIFQRLCRWSRLARCVRRDPMRRCLERRFHSEPQHLYCRRRPGPRTLRR